MKVYQAINAVQSDLAKSGIGKDRENTFDKYKFRGIDDVYNALSPLLAKHGLCILPRILKREIVERESQKGGALFYVTVEAEFDFVCAEDGSKHVVRTFGEAMDRGDKATNKAMSAAYKYAAFQAFAIPTEGDNDADATTHDIKPKKEPAERTVLMKHLHTLQEQIANQRDLGALQTYDEAWDRSEEFATSLWNSLTTPQQEYISRLLDERTAKAKKAA